MLQQVKKNRHQIVTSDYIYYSYNMTAKTASSNINRKMIISDYDPELLLQFLTGNFGIFFPPGNTLH